MRNLLDKSSVAQCLDGEPSDGEPAFPRCRKLIRVPEDRKGQRRRPGPAQIAHHRAGHYGALGDR
jgi:hypothetical protein